MTDSTSQHEDDSRKSAKHNRAMVITLALVFVGMVALIVLNMN